MREYLNKIFHIFQKQPLHTKFFYLLILFLPTQLGYHFWPSWSLVNGQRIDYLSPTLYLTDILIFLTLFFWLFSNLSNLSNWSNSIKKLVVPVVLVILFSVFYLNPLAHLFKLLKLFELYLLFIYIKTNVGARFSRPQKTNNLTMQSFNHIAILLIIGLFFESFLSFFQFLNQHSINGLFYFFGERLFNSSTPGIAQAIINGQLILRPYGTFSHPNSLAGYFLVCLFLIVSLRGKFTLSERSESEGSNLLCCHSGRACPPLAGAGIYKIINSSYFLFLTINFSLLTIFLSFSRSVWLIATLFFFLIGLLNIKKLISLLKNFKILIARFAVAPARRVILIFAFCLLVLSAVEGLPFIAKPAYERIISLKTTDAQSYQKRVNLNSLAMKMFLSSPLIGVGLNNFIPNIPRFTQNQPQIRLYQPVHNIYLLVLAESGLLGFSIFMFLIYKTIKLSLHSLSSIFYLQPPSSTFYLLSSLIVILLTGLFDHYWFTLQQNQLLFTLIIGLIFANLKTNKK